MFDWFIRLFAPWQPCRNCGRQTRIVFKDGVWTILNSDKTEHRCRG
jgi:hypothetical protein